MEDHLRRRVRALQMTLGYQAWRESFANPAEYRPELYNEMELDDDFVITFGYRGSSVKVPLVLFCSISKELHMMVLTRPRRGLSICLKGEHGYPFWWLRKFLQYKTPLPGVEGTALVLLMAHKYDIKCLVSMCRAKLCFYLCMDSFPYVYNAAVETQDENLLERCGQMVALWTDELLSLPNLSALGKTAMLDLLGHANLSPSSELNVFNAIINWWRNRGGKCYDDLCFLDDLRSCMDKVRFLLLTEHDFKYHVLPSEVIPFEDVEVMLRMIRGEQQRRHGLAYYVHDPVLQGTRRPRLLKIVKLGVQVADRTIPEPGLLYKKNTDDRSIAWFTVDKLCHIRAISSTSILDDSGGTLTVTNNHGFLASQKWVHYSSTFEQPLTLQPNIPYDFVHTSKTGVSDEECSVPMKKTVGGVTFEGLLYCTSLTLEFATTLSESESDSKSESSSSESENDTGTSSSDGAGSIEVIQEAEVRIAELHLSAAEQGKSQNGEALGQESRRPNGGGASTQAAADRKSANNEVHQQPMLRVSQQKMFRELMDEALKDD